MVVNADATARLPISFLNRYFSKLTTTRFVKCSDPIHTLAITTAFASIINRWVPFLLCYRFQLQFLSFSFLSYAGNSNNTSQTRLFALKRVLFRSHTVSLIQTVFSLSQYKILQDSIFSCQTHNLTIYFRASDLTFGGTTR